MDKLLLLLLISFYCIDSKGQERILYSFNDTTLFKEVELTETKTWCYNQQDTSYLFITNPADFNYFDCKSKKGIDFTKYNFLQIYLNTSGCKRPDINIHIYKNLMLNENILFIDVKQYGNCAMSDHFFFSYLISKEDCPILEKKYQILNIEPDDQ